jgi:uncharacterized protein
VKIRREFLHSVSLNKTTLFFSLLYSTMPNSDLPAAFVRALERPHLANLPPIVLESMRYGAERLIGGDASHDPMHLLRVLSNARAIAREEHNPDVDPTVVMVGAALHDVADRKLIGCGLTKSDAIDRLKTDLLLPAVARSELTELQVAKIIDVVTRVSYSIMMEEKLSDSSLGVCAELAIVRDADLLDSIGAIGIVRCLVWGATKNRPFRNPDTPNVRDWMAGKTVALADGDYGTTSLSRERSSVDHFYDKLLLVKNVLATGTARVIAIPLHDAMILWLDQLDRQMSSASV